MFDKLKVTNFDRNVTEGRVNLIKISCEIVLFKSRWF